MSLTARDIIKRAYRTLGSLASGDNPSADELADGFLAFNTMLRGMYGDIIGPRLAPQAMTATMQAENGGLYQCALSAPATLTAPLKPKNGNRFGVIDVNASFAADNLTIARNGQLFVGAATNLVLSTNGASAIWFFDSDSGNWSAEGDLATVDTVPPFPDRLITFLPDMLATFVGAEFGAEIRPDVVSNGQLGLMSFARNYGRRGRNQLDAPLGLRMLQPQQSS